MQICSRRCHLSYQLHSRATMACPWWIGVLVMTMKRAFTRAIHNTGRWLKKKNGITVLLAFSQLFPIPIYAVIALGQQYSNEYLRFGWTGFDKYITGQFCYKQLILTKSICDKAIKRLLYVQFVLYWLQSGPSQSRCNYLRPTWQLLRRWLELQRGWRKFPQFRQYSGV